MKVLVVHNRYRSDAPSGENRVVDQEAEALIATGHQVDFFGRSNDEIPDLSLRRKALIPLQAIWSNESRQKLRTILRRNRPDVVHIHNTFPLLSVAVLHACRDEKIPAIVTLHNYRLMCANGSLFRDGVACHDCLGHLPTAGVRHGCYRSSAMATTPVALGIFAHRSSWREMPSAFIFVSQAQRDLFKVLELPIGRTFVKPNLVPRIQQSAVVSEHKIVFVGRLSTDKGLLALMAAWDQFSLNDPRHQLRLAIAGSGPLERRIREWADQRPMVDVTGLLTREECAQLVASSRAIVVPSEVEETFGLVVVEAMAQGIPPVVSGIGAFKELVRDGHSGVIFEPGSVAALTRVFTDIDRHPARYRELGQHARTAYLQQHNPTENINRLLSIYKFAVDNPIVSIRRTRR